VSSEDLEIEQYLRKLLRGPQEIVAVGHRIVHGGDRFRDPVRITPMVVSQLAELADMAPEHNYRQIQLIEQAQTVFGSGTPQVAVFDTAFHATLPCPAYTYGGPYEWLKAGIRRYGFHGLSHRYATRKAAELLGRNTAEVNLITCHLGNGCSLAAIKGGVSVDTTMGFTPLEGLLMGSRSGSVDPAILIHLQRKHGHSVDELDRILNEKSGLKGLSGISSDMRDIEAAREKGEPRAVLAFDCFVHQLCRGIGAMLASTGVPDAIVFTGGIGENSAAVRDAACDRFSFLSAGGSKARVLVVKAQEEWEIAQDVQRTLADPAR
jgi:acetate kinase